ncbi:30S ribosomal protein S15 [Candidatus Aenigmatarchaeota archaeon]
MTTKTAKKSKDQKYDKEEVIKLVKKLEKEGHGPSMIGLILRDQYGISTTRSYGLRTAKLVERKEVPEDMYNLLVKVVALHTHMAANKRDSTSKHGLEKAESKIRRLGKYYKRKGHLPENWKYTIESARLLVR